MTAVAEGASIFAESIDWSSSTHARKSANKTIKTDIALSFKSTVWINMTCSEYKSYFDSDASTSIFNSYADEITFSSPKRIHGVAKKCDSVLSGLSADTGTTLLIDFTSVD